LFQELLIAFIKAPSIDHRPGSLSPVNISLEDAGSPLVVILEAPAAIGDIIAKFGPQTKVRMLDVDVVGLAGEPSRCPAVLIPDTSTVKHLINKFGGSKVQEFLDSMSVVEMSSLENLACPVVIIPETLKVSELLLQLAAASGTC
jgi:hypothetical protein